MCIVHDESLHYLFQNMLDAFEKSKMLTRPYLSRLGCLICTCKKDLFYESKTLIQTQRDLLQWFDNALNKNSILEMNRTSSISSERLSFFRSIVYDLKQNGCVDSGTKITFLRILKDLVSLDYSKFRTLCETTPRQNESEHNSFFTKLVVLKFDLNLCSAKEFVELLNKLDNCALKYIQLINKCKITPRCSNRLTLRNFMGELEVTMEARSERAMQKAELNLKKLADAIHYRLVKQMPSSDNGANFNHVKVLLQSPPSSGFSSPAESSINVSTENNNHRTSRRETSEKEAMVGGESSSSPHDSSLSSSPIYDKHQKAKKKKNGAKTYRKFNRNKRTNNKNNETSSCNAASLNDDDSIIDFSRSSLHNETTTPLTSSPVSTSSGSLQMFKLSQKHDKDSNNNERQKQKSNNNNNKQYLSKKNLARRDQHFEIKC